MSEFTIGRPVRIYDVGGQHSDVSTEELVSRKFNYFRGWKCAAGKENINIDFDGYALFASCGVGTHLHLEDPNWYSGILGNVYDGYLIIPKEWITCNIDACACGADIFIPKYDPNLGSEQHLKKFNNESTQNDLRLEPNSQSITNVVAVERTHTSKYKQVFWELARRCNFNCSYCPDYVHNNTENHKNWDTLYSAYELIKEKFLLGNSATFVISGGEPTVNPNYMDLVKLLHDEGHKISTHSNGSRTPKYYAELICYSDINFSIHFEYLDRYTINLKGQEKFIKIISTIIERMTEKDSYGSYTFIQPEFRGHCEVMFMVMPGKLEEALELEQKLLRIPKFLDYCTHTFMPIRTNELANAKGVESIIEGREGNELLSDYTKEELEQMGARSDLYEYE